MRDHLKKLIEENIILANTIEIALNIDGLPLFKSSMLSFWVILGRVIGMEKYSSQSVFPICLTLGSTKPKDLNFLNDLTAELITLTTEGIPTSQGIYKIVLNHIVCDAPAKSLVKATKLYSGYAACFDCNIRGLYFRHRMIYPEFQNLLPRTDESFRSKSDKNHHTRTSPFCDLPIDMITAFPIDYMHSCLLGVMKKLLLAWCVDSKGSSKLSAAHITVINSRLDDLKRQTPAEFARKPRSTLEVSRWKATEFRTFLLYTGKVVMKDILSHEKYLHFLAFSLALAILLSPSLIESLRGFAHSLLEYFVSRCSSLYGQQFLVYNIHSLLHLAEQTTHYGVLDSCAAFPFEDYMQVIKQSIRQGNAPLAQAVKRVKERLHQPGKSCASSVPRSISTKPPNNVYLTKEGHVIELVKISYATNGNGGQLEKQYICRRYLQPQNEFVKPCSSKLLGIFKVNPSLTCFVKIAADQIQHKCFKMNTTEGTLIQKIIHK